jgi:hypothetical protein
MSEDPREAIERAARAHREGVARATDPAGGRKERDARQERDARRKMLEESLWQASKGGNVVLFSALMAMVAAPAYLFFFALPESTHEFVLWNLCGVASIAASFFVVLVPGSRALTAWHALAVRRIGHGFDAESYLDLLSRKRRNGRLVATLRFDDAWDESLRHSTTEAIGAWCPDLERAHWEDDRALRLQTAELATVVSYRKKSFVRTFTNYPLHDRMKCIARTVLPRLDAVHPVTRIDVAIDGDECPFDAKP